MCVCVCVCVYKTLEMFLVIGTCDVFLKELLDLPMCFISILWEGGREVGREEGGRNMGF